MSEHRDGARNPGIQVWSHLIFGFGLVLFWRNLDSDKMGTP